MGIFIIIVGAIPLLIALSVFGRDNEKVGEEIYKRNRDFYNKQYQSKEEYITEFIKGEKRTAKKMLIVGIILILLGSIATIHKYSDNSVDLPGWWNKSPDEMTDKEYKEYNDFLDYDAPQDND